MAIAVNIADVRAIVRKYFQERELDSWHRLKGGVSADVFKLEFKGGKSAVLRIHGDRHSGHDVQLEFDLLQALFSKGVLSPRPIAVDSEQKVIPYPYLLMEFVEGSTAVSEAFSDEAIGLMAKGLVEVHNKELLGLPTLPGRIEPFPLAFEFLPEEMTSLKALIEGTPSTFCGDQKLLHGDYWPENVMWKDEEIVAIIDWEDAAIGDPLSDVACCYLELRYIYGTDGADKFVNAYAEFAPIDPIRFQLWKIHVSAAAQKFMGLWGLPAEKEAHKRQTALLVIHETHAALQK